MSSLAIYDLKDDGKYLQVRDEGGNWIFRSKRMIAENPYLPAPDRLPSRGLIAEFRQANHQVRILSCPIVVGQKHYSVQTGIALDKSITLLAQLARQDSAPDSDCDSSGRGGRSHHEPHRTQTSGGTGRGGSPNQRAQP